MVNNKYIIVVGLLTTRLLKSVDCLLKDKLLSDICLIVLTRNIDFTHRVIARYQPDFEIQVIDDSSFDGYGIKKMVEPFKDQIAGIICRGDGNIQDLRKLVPYLPSSVLISSKQALTIATNKKIMREAFTKYDPKMTPKYIKVDDASNSTIEKIEQQLSYPVIIKPTNLASSLLIQDCKTRLELKAALNNIFKVIGSTYQREQRRDPPEVIAEEYFDGDCYSIDAYALNDGEVYFCPPVLYIPAKQIGIDDFFIYKRILPSSLSKSEINKANVVTKKAIMAVGLEYSTVHVELVHTKSGDWKVIELGPRPGRFRDTMYKASYNIDHSLNDLKLHLGLKPIINNNLVQYSAAYSVYPNHEGKLINIWGLDELKASPSYKWRRISAKPGDLVYFAKHGGHSLAEYIIACDTFEDFANQTAYFEKHIYAEIS